MLLISDDTVMYRVATGINQQRTAPPLAAAAEDAGYNICRVAARNWPSETVQQNTISCATLDRQVCKCQVV